MKTMASLAEEKKDDEGNYHLVTDDRPQSIDEAHDSLENESIASTNENDNPSICTQNKEEPSPPPPMHLRNHIILSMVWNNTRAYISYECR